MIGGIGDAKQWMEKMGKSTPCWAGKHFDKYGNNDEFYYFKLCLLHSGSTAKRICHPVSSLHWPDKLGSVLQPWWLWAGLGLLSGEIHEYTNNPEFTNILGRPGGYKEYFMAYRKHVLKQEVFRYE